MTRDTWIGVAFLAFAVIYWIAADHIRISPLDGPVTAAGLPKSLAYALGLLAMLLIVRSQAMARMAAGKAARAAAEAPAPERREPAALRRHLRALGMLGLGLAYLLAIPYLGYALSVIALLLAVALYVGARLGVKTLTIAGLGGVFFYLLFVQFLHIPLPPGIWPALLKSVQG